MKVIRTCLFSKLLGEKVVGAYNLPDDEYDNNKATHCTNETDQLIIFDGLQNSKQNESSCNEISIFHMTT